jgi:hypothetical protein
MSPQDAIGAAPDRLFALNCGIETVCSRKLDEMTP